MSIFSGGGSGGQTPTPPDVPKNAPTPPSFGTSLINKASATPSFGFASSILTSGQGDLKPLATAKKTLLGQ